MNRDMMNRVIAMFVETSQRAVICGIEKLKVKSKKYLGDEEAIKQAINSVKSQGKVK